MIPCRISISVREVDPDYLRLDISMADGDFAGRADVYEGLDFPEILARSLEGFPRTPDDRREIVIGSFDPSHAGGAIKLVLRCINRAGHAVVDAELENVPMDGTRCRQQRAMSRTTSQRDILGVPSASSVLRVSIPSSMVRHATPATRHETARPLVSHVGAKSAPARS